MGNSGQKFYRRGRNTKKKEEEEEPRRAERPKKLPPDILTDQEIEDIQLSFPHLRPHMNQIITQAFLDLFAENPDVKDKFMGFRNYSVEDLKRTEKGKENALQRHVPRVTHAIVKIINHVDNLDNVLDYLECVGKIHNKNGIMHHEIMALGPFFVSAALPHLPSKMREGQASQDIADSWARFFAVMTDLLRHGYPNTEVELSEEEKNIIRNSFRAIGENLGDVGVATFVGLFQTHSTSKMFFPIFKDSPLEDVSHSEALKNHGMRLMKVIETVVKDLDRPPPCPTDLFLSQLGSMHQTMGIEKKYLDAMGPIFCHSIRPTLQEEGCWDMEVRHAWLHLFRIIVLKMKRGYKEIPERGNLAEGGNEEEEDEEEREGAVGRDGDFGPEDDKQRLAV